jgi:multisubunit Na+/H+ antiporter MnhE subunit
MKRLMRIVLPAWAASMLVWLALTGTLQASELLVGAVASVIGAAGAAAALLRRPRLVRLTRGWAKPLLKTPVNVFRDSWLLTVELSRMLGGHRPRGSFRWVDVDLTSDRASNDLRETVLTLAISMAPNSIVIGVDRDAGRALVHELLPTHPDSAGEMVESS